ncbi:MAG: MipA/OmpV family protein [Pseudomonadota bacterium]
MNAPCSRMTKRIGHRLGMSATFTLIAFQPVFANEERAREWLLRDYPTAKIESVEEETRDGVTVYELEYELDDREYEAVYHSNGRLLDVKADSDSESMFFLGAAIEYETEHYRGESSGFGVAPLIALDNGTFFLQGPQAGFRFYKGLVDVAAFVEVELGAGYSSGDSDFLEGLDDSKTPVNLGVEFEKETDLVDLELSLKADVAGAYDGFVAELGIGKDVPLTDWLVLEAGVEIAYFDGNYNDTFYGVDEEFALAERPAYEADGDFNYSLELGSRSPVYDGLYLTTGVEYTLFGSEVADSPLVKGSDQFSAQIGFAYDIGRLYGLLF